MTLATLQFVLVLLVAPAMLGLVRASKARFQNRIGANIFVPYWQLVSLLKKEMTITRHSSWVFRFVPFAVLATALFAALIVPAFVLGTASLAMSNVFLFAATLALGSIFLVMGGMDTGSTFGNMGSSREMTLAAIIEPAMFVSLAGLGALAGTWYLGAIFIQLSQAPWAFPMATALIVVALTLVALLENARYPVDNPATHLELTMVHEAMILEYSGPYLAMLEYASALKLTVLSILVMNVALPFSFVTTGALASDIGIAVVAFLAKLAVAAVVIAAIESLVVKMRFYRMQEYATLAYLAAVAGLIAALAAIHS